MRVGLFGFGRAGKAVASELLLDKSAYLSWVIRKSSVLQHRSAPEFLGVDSDEPGLIFPVGEWRSARLLEQSPVDAIIDFANTEAIHTYGEQAADAGVAIVSAVSEYPPETIEYLAKLAERTRVLWSPNITIGVNFLMLAAKVLQSIAPYTDIQIVEEHFRAKKGTSGTARKIAGVLDVPEEEIKVIRAGGIVGRHEILFGFPHQTVRLSHESIGREAFGHGALFGAKALQDKENGLYRMEDLLIPYFHAVS